MLRKAFSSTDCPFLFAAPILLVLWSFSVGTVAQAAKLSVEPQSFVLRGVHAKQRLVVSDNIDGREVDATRKVAFVSENPGVVQVDANGVVTPIADGQAKVVATLGEDRVVATVEVSDTQKVLPVNFQLDVMPVLTARGCNMGACHGKARGQNGFQLSLLGFDSDFDYDALTKNARGRRVFPAAAERSLLLLKATAQLPHGGGERIKLGDGDYQTLLRWIDSGLPRRVEGQAVLERITVFPTRRFMKSGEQQQMLVTAHYSDGSTRDVTHLAAFQSSESPVVAINSDGRFTAGMLPGEATMMARYMGQIETCHVSIPLEGEVPDSVYENLPVANFIDSLVWKKLQSLNITPSAGVDDAKFIRRVYVDIIGRLPTPKELRELLADTSPDRRTKLVDALLERPEYADHWASKWGDLLRPVSKRVGIKALMNYDSWIRQSFRENKPYDQFVRELVTARGSTWRHGAVTLYRDRRTPDEVTTMMSQLFLGIRLECAKCHHHPFEKWDVDDFYSFAAYFGKVGHNGGLSPPISGSEEKVYTLTKVPATRLVKNPFTEEVLEPRPLFGVAPEIAEDDDPREALAEWMTSTENEFFPKVMANRVWADLMGRGIVEPVDDLRVTNPPSNGPLLDALAEEFRKQNYDLKKLIRTITTSHVYSLSSNPTERNVTDLYNYSRNYRKRLRAEVLHDAVCDITEVPTNFVGMPPGSRASQLWTRRIGSLFLDTFGRPDANQAPPCERTGESTVTQSLHLMNAPTLHQKVTSDSGRAAKMAASPLSNEQIVEEVYLLIYNRFPDEAERVVGKKLFAQEGMTRRQATEDLMWALFNTAEFVFKD